MGIGASLVLIALGAILAFGVEIDVAGLDLRVIGYILMVVGVIGAVLSMLMFGPRRSVSRETVVRDPDVPGEREIVRERRDW